MCVSFQCASVLLQVKKGSEHTKGVKCADDVAGCWAKGILVQVLVLEAVHGGVRARIRVGTVVGALPSHGWPRERETSFRSEGCRVRSRLRSWVGSSCSAGRSKLVVERSVAPRGLAGDPLCAHFQKSRKLSPRPQICLLRDPDHAIEPSVERWA